MAHIAVAQALTTEPGAPSRYYDCNACAREPGLMLELGHDGPPRAWWREHLVTGEPLAECPVRTMMRMDDETPGIVRRVVRARDVYLPQFEQRGMLPNAGGLDDQPAGLMDLIRCCADTHSAVETTVAIERAKRAKGAA